MASDANPLIQKDLIPIRGWGIAIFLAVLPLLLVPATLLVRGHGTLAVITTFFAVALVAVAAAVAPMGWAALPALGFRAVGWRPVVLGVVVTEVLSVGVSQLGIEPEGMKEVTRIAREPALFAASLFALAVLAPLVEELIFRGLLYGWLAGHWGTIVAWIVSSLAFAAAHIEWKHIVLVLPLGLWFGWLRRRTGSLWPSLVSHIVNNGLAVAAAAYLDM
ncbi:MAG TPA: CPBP family intramembrane glutamic endopeptidase [Reyranella sp.]|nr:CPBP family intramembrane glutamic endopeptidase [Reyranella sp.]